jgi:hypothetical protein
MATPAAPRSRPEKGTITCQRLPELAVAGEQGAGVTEPAWSLRRIRGDPGDCADSSLRRIT